MVVGVSEILKGKKKISRTKHIALKRDWERYNIVENELMGEH